MNVELFREIITRREYVEKISHGEWADGIEECWKREIKVLSDDVPGTIVFLKTQCTAAEYSWISEIIEELAAMTQNKELVEVYKSLLSKFPEESEMYNIADSIRFAEGAIAGEKEDGK